MKSLTVAEPMKVLTAAVAAAERSGEKVISPRQGSPLAVESKNG